MALASHPVGVGVRVFAAGVESRNSLGAGRIAALCDSCSSRSSNDLSSHSRERIASRSIATTLAGPRIHSRGARCSSVSLQDSDASPSQANDERASFVSSPNFQTGKTPSGSNRIPSLAEQLRLSVIGDSSGDGSSDGGAVEARGQQPIGAKRDRQQPRYAVERWAPRGSKYNRATDVLQLLKGAEGEDEGAVERALQNWDGSLGARDVCAVISGLKWRKALSFFRWAQRRDFELNIVVYNVLLGAMRAGRQWKVAEAFALDMVRDGLPLDNYTFSTLISCALQCKAPRDALAWFDRMQAAGVVPDEVTYSTMTLVFSRLGRFDEAVELYETLRLTGWKPDRVTFGSMVNVYARAGKYQKASAVIKEMKDIGMQPDAVVYNTMIKFFAREGKTGQAKRVFKEMEAVGIKASEYTLSLMIDVHGRSGNVEEALALFARMKAENLPLDTAVYNSLLKMCGEERMVAEGERLVAEMAARGLKRDEMTYKSLVNLYAKEGRIDDAVRAMQQMAEAGCPADVVVYSCLIKACGSSKQFERAEQFFEDMLASGASVDDSLLLSEDVNSGDLEDQVRSLLADSVSDSQRPFCNSLIDFCWTLGHKERAESLLALADSLKVYPGSLRTHTNLVWILHLRSLSFSTALCALSVWINFLRNQVAEEQELPETLVIETGAGRNRGGDEIRLISVILAELKEMSAPFEASPERADWLVASGASVKSWLSSGVKADQDRNEISSEA
ncbi:hypothetical protein AXG93_48s1010 [Marchantia polymorpha subsp. ruderalis]|uniref:Smr domain-containing protein n=1 Tax=Marchantia polymorpha subsp. ruderalis TaxID=1480154 RepID=A0A176VVC4_MARPO|nr:hypothetical protein AXG93_48s1010 [Marchantia polymorpha subsp. ruderalis]